MCGKSSILLGVEVRFTFSKVEHHACLQRMKNLPFGQWGFAKIPFDALSTKQQKR